MARIRAALGLGAWPIIHKNHRGQKTWLRKWLAFRVIRLATCHRFLAITRARFLILFLAIKVVRLALEAEEDDAAERGTARIALDHLEDMAAQLKQKWCEDYASVK